MAEAVQQNVSQTTIPDYARPYVEDMLGQTAALTDLNQNPYQSFDGQRIAGFTPMQTEAFNRTANQQVAGQVGEASNLASTAGQGMLNTVNPAGQYGQIGNAYGNMAAGMAPQAQQYGSTGAGIGTLGGLGYGSMGAQQGMSYGQNATNPYAVQSYMNPYLQSALNPQLDEIRRQYNISGAQQQGQAVRAGAFGGNRESLMRSENNRNMGTAMNKAIGEGYNQAYNTANTNMQQAANLGMQGAGLGLQGVGAAMQGQEMGLKGLNAANTFYGQGMAGAQIGLQGVGAQQAGLSGANQAASTLGQLGQSQFDQQQSITDAQNRAGAVQQAQQQQGLDVNYQDFQDQKNYPYKQLGFQSDMLRGLPLNQNATSMYQAPPNAASQIGGLGMTAAGIYGMAQPRKANGGQIKSMADGGLAGYSLGGEIEAMNLQQLTKLLDSPSLGMQEKEMVARRIMLLKRMESNPESQKTMAPAMGQRAGIGAIATGDMVPEQMAGGGIVAFATGDVVKLQNKQPSQNTDDLLKTLEARQNAMYSRLFEESDPFTESKAKEAEIKAQAEKNSNLAFYRALAKTGAKTLAGKSPNGFTNLGEGLDTGLEDYAKSASGQDETNKLLLEQAGKRENSKYARDMGAMNALNSSIGNIYAKKAAASRAGEGSEEKALLRVQAMINQDDQLPLLYKQRDLLEPNDPKYKAYNDAINSIKKGYFDQAGIKRPYIAPAQLQFPEEEKKPGFFDRIFGSSKPPAAAKSPGVIKFDKDGNQI